MAIEVVMRLCLPFFALPLLVACGDNNIHALTLTDTFEQAPSNKVDILWVIDNSTSMNEEQDAVAAAADSFLDTLSSADMDFHLGVITTDISAQNASAGVLLGSPNVLTGDCLSDGNDSDCTYASTFTTLIRQGTDGDDQEKGLSAALTAVTPPLSDTFNAGFLRDDSKLMIIILSDENDCSDGGTLGPESTGSDCYDNYDQLIPVANLVREFQNVKKDTGGITMNGIIGPDIENHCSDSVPGTRYSTAIAMLGGIEADICLDDYSGVMASLGLQASGILDTFQLSNAAIEDTIEVRVAPPESGDYEDVGKDDTNGWNYISDYAQVHFNGDSVPERGSMIEVSYQSAGYVPEDTGGADTGS